MLKCQDCPLWQRHEAPGVARQVIGFCSGEEIKVRYSQHATPGLKHSWPHTFQDDCCECHPEFDAANPPPYDEPFWTVPAGDVSDKPIASPKRITPARPKPARQASLFD